MTETEFYKEELPRLKEAQKQLMELLSEYAANHKEEGSLCTVQSVISRIKEPESMSRKLKERGLSINSKTAVTEVYDALGLRVICSFPNGVYHLAEWLKQCPGLQLIQEKDYISYPKANGYRSYHVIVKISAGAAAGLFAEIQIRTIAQDFWASLEHQIKYKHKIAHEELIKNELKRCADEIASIDLTMQTIQELIQNV